MKKILCIILTVLLMISVFPTRLFTITTTATSGNTEDFAGGSGTKADPYQISTLYHLTRVEAYLDACFILTNDIIVTNSDHMDEWGKGSSDWALIGWDPIGSEQNPFSGVFDGNNFSIDGIILSANGKSPISAYGFFEYNNGTIKNLNLVNLDFNIVSTNVNERIALGGICGNNTGVIINCSVEGSLQNYAQNGYASTGGIVGYTYSNIENCNNNSSVSSNGDTGGIVGSSCSVIWMSGISIINCYNTGSIYSNSCAGGIIGSAGTNGASHTITNCYNKGIITSDDTAGGIAADAVGNISNCYNTDSVIAKKCSGGIVGFNSRSNISSCYNVGAITSNSGVQTTAGGIVGYSSSTKSILNCYNSGDISSNGSPGYAGGLVACLSDSNIDINNCYNVGKIIATTWAGGIAGFEYSGNSTVEIENCYFIDTCTKGTGAGTTGNSKKCTSTEMQKSTTYKGFDFETIWEFAECNYYKYPTLREVEYFGITHTYDNICDTQCNICEAEREVPDHSFDENMQCEHCGYIAYITGDCNGDEDVNTTDLAVIKLFLAAIENLTDTGLLAGDLNGDGNVDTTDLAMLKLKLAGID